MTVSVFASDFEKRGSLNLAPKTIAMYDQAFKNFTRICGSRLLKYVRPLDVEKFKAQRAQEISPISVNIELRSLRAAFGEARRLKLIEENPFDGVKQLRIPFKEAKYLSELEFTKLLLKIEDTDFRSLIKFAVFTMMRLGEIVHLRWCDVDMERKEIRIRSSEGFRVKGGKPRTIPMNPWVHSFLISNPHLSELVFPNRRGYVLDGRAISRKLKCYVLKAGLDPGIHFHSLRHTGISWLMNKGVPPQFVQRIAGHSSLKVTEIYTHLEDKNLISAISAFGPIMSN